MERKIELSKRKITSLLIGSLLFVAMSSWFIYRPEKFSKALFNSELAVYIVGSVGILFFGLCAFFIFQKLISKQVGFIINKEGITDNSSGLSVGFIHWGEINSFEIYQITTQKFISVILKDPENYINKIDGKLKKSAMRLNYKTSLSPINISPNSLKINFDELYQLLNTNLIEYKDSVI